MKDQPESLTRLPQPNLWAHILAALLIAPVAVVLWATAIHVNLFPRTEEERNLPKLPLWERILGYIVVGPIYAICWAISKVLPSKPGQELSDSQYRKRFGDG